MRQCERCGTRMQPFQARITVRGLKMCEGCGRHTAALDNPIADQTGKHPQEWYHGSPHEFEHFDGDPGADSSLAYDDDPFDTTHWNTLLGHHFTSDHEVASDFAGGEHSSSANTNKDGPLGHVIHVKLHLNNPKVYKSEHDMDQEVHEFEHGRGNTMAAHYDSPPPNAPRYVHDDFFNEIGYAAHFADDKDGPFDKNEPDPTHAYGFHPKATGWLNTHPDKHGIAMRFRDRLKDQGHDGVVYGNEYEGSRYGRQAASAIAFEPHQIEITQHHYGKQGCLNEDDARKRTVHPGQEMVPGTQDARRTLPGEVRPDTSKHWPKTWTPSFFEHRETRAPGWHQTTGSLLGHDTGRLWTPLPQKCWDRYYGRMPRQASGPVYYHGTAHSFEPGDLVDLHTAAVQPHGEQSALNDAGQQDVYAVRSGHTMVNLCGYHRDVHVGNASAADALGDQLGLGGRERSAESLGGARKGSCAACNRDTSYQLKLLTPRWMQNASDSRQRRRPDKPLRTRPLPTLKQSENARRAFKGDVFHADPGFDHNTGGVRFNEENREGDHSVPAGAEMHDDENQAWHRAIEHWDSGRSGFPRVYVVHQPQVEGGRLTRPAEASELEYDHTRHPALRSGYDDPDEPIMYHGTTKGDYDEDPEEITPSGGARSFGPGIADSSHAYATPHLGNAWDYAHKRAENGHSGRPTVYRVTPHNPGDVEKDPGYAGGYSRGNYEHDKRSKSGFRVLDEVPMSQKQEHEWSRSPHNDEADHDWDDGDEGHYGSLKTLAAWEQGELFHAEPVRRAPEPSHQPDPDEDEEPRELCEECGEPHTEDEGHRECRACGERHGDHEEKLRHEGSWTDWDEVYPHLADEVHRGLRVTLPDHLHDMVHDPSQPVHERAQKLMDHVVEHEGLGMHWTDDRNSADKFLHGGRGKTHVLLHAKTPDRTHIETDPDELNDHQVISYGDHDEAEVPIRLGAPVHVKGISWQDPELSHTGHGWTRHDFPGGQRHTAAKADWKRHTFKEPIKAMSSKKSLPTLRTLAHDATENQAVRHCFSCGGGKIIGRADGSIECEFCGVHFTVQVQPQYPNFPQTVNGVPQQIPGMPGQVETPGAAPGMDGGGFPPDDQSGLPPGGLEGADGPVEGTDEGAEEMGDEEPPPFAKKESFRTTAGAVLDEDDYVRHLAIRYASDRDAMIARIRAERGAQ